MTRKIHTLRFIPAIILILMCACSSPQSTTTEVIEATALPDLTKETVVETSAAPPPEPADIIFYNGNLITIEENQPIAQALAVHDGLIVAVGNNDEVFNLQGADTSLVDLQGFTLLPGFIDGHNHMLTFYDRMGKTLADAQQAALEHGFTSMSEMWANEDVVNGFLQEEQNGGLRLRVNLFPSYNDGILGSDRRRVLMQTWYPDHEPILDPQRMVRIPGIKIFVDGDNANPQRGCWALSDPFEPGAGVLSRGVCGTLSGDLYWEQAELNQVVRAAQEDGYRVAFHAMGDQAIETALNAIEYALDGQSNEIYRHQIEHNSMVRPDLLNRYQELGVASTVRGHIDVCDMSSLEPAFGPDRTVWYVNRFMLPTLGIHTFIETDFGWLIDPEYRYDQRTLDPFMHLYGYVTHRYASSETESCAPDRLAADKTISVQRALEMMTIEAAWAVSMENQIGSLKVGKYADLIVISGDPLTIEPDFLKDLSVLMTIVNGKQEYCANSHEDICPENLGHSATIQDLPNSGNLALNQPIMASNSVQFPPEGAVDGDEATSWGAGDFAPQWIEINLGAPADISEFRLLVEQSPDGKTQHRLLVGLKGETLNEIHMFDDITRSGTWMIYTPAVPVANVQIIRVETLASPSWISWREIQVIGSR